MRALIGVALLLTITVAAAPCAAAEDYWINVAPIRVNGFTVEAAIETNIPGAISLAARLVYVPPKEESGYIGTGFIRFVGARGQAKMTIDGLQTAEPRGFKLPNGNYDLEVYYHYLWPGNTTVTMETGIGNNIKGIASISLSADETDDSRSISQEDGLRWVVENVVEGHYWDPQFWLNKFGNLEEVLYSGPGNADKFKMYYVKSINVTLLVDESNGTIKAYRIGLAHE